MHRGWIVNKLELELEGDLNITAVWGTGDVSEKPVGFTDVRVKVDMECEGVAQDEIDALVAHVKKWSPVANTFTRPSISRSACSRPVLQQPKVRRRSMGSLALSRVEASDQPAPSIADEVARDRAARSWRRWPRPSTAARSIRRMCCAASARPAPGAAMSRRMAPADLRCAIQSIAALGEVCGATAFMAWCQNTLVWYAANSCNLQARRRVSATAFSTGRVLGGTGLSNPMKTFFGIEKFKLKGRKVEGGYIVKGALPWVSNLGPDHFFGTIFEREDEPGEHRHVPGRLLRSRDHAARPASRSWPWTAPAPTACSSATCSCRTT